MWRGDLKDSRAQAIVVGTAALKALDAGNFAYLALDAFLPSLAGLLALRPVLGLRSPANSVARLLNPFAAGTSLVGVFHPGFRELHAGAGQLLGQGRLAVLKGAGGEFERTPDKTTVVFEVRGGDLGRRSWPALAAKTGRPPPHGDLDRLAGLWRGDLKDSRAQAIVVGTAALALQAAGRVETPAEAEARAGALWSERDRGL